MSEVIGAHRADEINEFLARNPHHATRNDYRKEIVMLWVFCRPRKWVSESLDRTHVPRETQPEKGRVILTTDEAERLMEASTDPDIYALNAIVLFAAYDVRKWKSSIGQR